MYVFNNHNVRIYTKVYPQTGEASWGRRDGDWCGDNEGNGAAAGSEEQQGSGEDVLQGGKDRHWLPTVGQQEQQ